ncbi:PREDICTED: uclacyanin-3-like [Nicotiana attenuata]|uniref:Blue copper protein n=1 Tax=Nicotiana attenuata TaxID=49451 RepID=A0A1J6KP59_NICAT|nr:PREDICTED: uclacyanin-3-like [Nicotiana attenuata]OIT20969.1 blue copper protein [Nicotiana attenuata]
MAMLRTLLSLAAIAMVFGSAMAANHTVGGNSGWSQGADYTTWAASETFLVGDNLIFSYGLSHDVLEVTKANYDSCLTTNAISTNGGGMTVITLSSLGKRYFICGTGGHCASGMKLEVNTIATASPPPAAAPPVPPPASTPSTNPVVSSPTKSPASSPSPKSSAPSPKLAPKISPAKSPVSGPLSPNVEAPALPPSDASVPTPSLPSSANKLSVIAGSTVGFGFAVMMMFFLYAFIQIFIRDVLFFLRLFQFCIMIFLNLVYHEHIQYIVSIWMCNSGQSKFDC